MLYTISELCVIMQAKPTIEEAEKEEIVKDVNDAYHKSLKPYDNRRLRFVVSIWINFSTFNFQCLFWLSAW